MRTLIDIRPQAASILAPGPDDDYVVITDIVDSFEPPCILLLWDNPWLEPLHAGHADTDYARLEVLIVAGRLEPGPGVDTLEHLASIVRTRFVKDDRSWPPLPARAPQHFEVGGVHYLSASLPYRVPVNHNGGAS